MRIYGVNPVLEALRARRVASICVGLTPGERVTAALGLAEAQGIPVRSVPASELDRLSGGASHQGIVAEIHQARAYEVEDLVSATEPALIVVADGVEDPHNLGAILRSLDAAGGSGLVRQSRRAAPLGGATAKASAGAAAHVRVAEVVNIARALRALKTAGVWIVGLAVDGSKSYYELDLTIPTAIVVGSEGTGLRRLVREQCDWLVSIPMSGNVQSLNVSVATGILLFEAVRQRRQKAGEGVQYS
jgi:23S rRNA (guanosine2251-2'-O)-methyltransferase